MSSDYIPRLRGELLRAGARTQPRWRRAQITRPLRPLVAAAAVALVAATIVLALPGERSDEAPALSYRVASGAAEQTAQILRTRLASAGIRGAVVTPSGAGITVTVPAAATSGCRRADPAGRARDLRLGGLRGGPRRRHRAHRSRGHRR